MTVSKILLSTTIGITLLFPITVSPALAIDFGDNASQWANDGECDDPRFTGQGMANILLDEDIAHDANDCARLVSKGRITEKPISTKISRINFGDNTSQWANDSECDDPRFTGNGMASILLDEDIAHDANDCRVLLESGQIRFGSATLTPPSVAQTKPVPEPSPEPVATPLVEPVVEPLVKPVQTTPTSISSNVPTNIDFGDDSENRSNNGICDDSRFQGPGMAEELYDEQYQMHDATDCRQLFEQGQVFDLFAAPLSPTGDPDTMLLGDNSSEFANDGQCDDPRFAGPSVAYALVKQDLGRDANDCRTLLQQGLVHILAIPQENYHQGWEVYLGDDASPLANNDTCDDRRFPGPRLAGILMDENIGHDATDCWAALEDNMASVPTHDDKTIGGGKGYDINFGDNVSEVANNGVCDDPRFAGADMGQDLSDANIRHDAYDCQTRLMWRGIHLIEQ